VIGDDERPFIDEHRRIASHFDAEDEAQERAQ
jgi:hypothetical protein